MRTLLMMSLPTRLITLRKEMGLTQQQMADTIGIHVNSLKKIALELHVSTDCLLFDAHERGPSDDLSLKLEAVSLMPEDEQMVIREILESLSIKYQSRRWNSGRQTAK
ncbi:helix-turn-helix transcriptional regulator [Vibrio vulnificus]|nr:helix-turn-helix transcriptional regulator [Vibrio vulnificus]